MGADDFDRDFGRVSGALGDATRRGIYLTVRDSEQPLTAARIAQLFDIHPNVARHHLDRLVAEGYLQVSDRPASRPASAGRPPRTFEATDTDVAVAYPVRRHDLLAELLARTLKRLAPEEAGRLAEEVGREYGAELAAAMGLRSSQNLPNALAAVAEAMAGAGMEVTADLAHQRLLRGHCPFGRTAGNHADIVCRLDLGIVQGLMQAAGGRSDDLVITSRRHPGRSCLAG